MSTNLRTALKALVQNKLQALLTLCGMSVGVAMVVIVSGLGRGAQLSIEQQIEAAGPTQITIRSGNLRPAALAMTGEQDSSGGEPGEGVVALDAGADLAETDAAASRLRAHKPRQLKHLSPPHPLGEAEMQLLRRQIDNVRAVAASVEGNVSLDADAGLPVRILRLHGFEHDWIDIAGWKLQQGRMPRAQDVESGEPLMLVTPAVAKRLWPQAPSPLNQVVRMGRQSVRVVGVIADNGEEAGGIVVPTVYVPLKLAKSLLNRDSYDRINVRTTSVGVTTSVAKDIREQLRLLHRLPDDTLDDFRVETQSVAAMPGMGTDPRLARAVQSNVVEFEQASWEEMARSLRQAGRTFTLLLAAAAAVSLLVGGIGVMNIMLVSVTARTREIGLRMALGARTRDVMVQFLVEAVALAALGGLIGLLLGAAGLAVAKHGLHWATAVSPSMLLIAVLMAAATGIAFGYGPARRASVLDPVVALKAE